MGPNFPGEIMEQSLVSPAKYKPRPVRRAVSIETRLLLADGTVAAATLRNLSAQGFMAECQAFVAIGSAVELVLPGIGTREAVVRWALAGRIGGAFTACLDPGVVGAEAEQAIPALA